MLFLSEISSIQITRDKGDEKEEEEEVEHKSALDIYDRHCNVCLMKNA